MTSIKDICDVLDELAPTRLAEDWDNVGLLVGDADASAERLMTCLTVTPESADEAIERRVDLIVSHHPLPFRPLKRLTTDQTSSRLLWNLIRSGISIYSPHTGFDSAGDGINQMLAEKIELTKIEPIEPMVDDPDSLGAGRMGNLENQTVGSLVTKLKTGLGLQRIQIVGTPDQHVTRAAIACGSGGSFLAKSLRAGCDAFLTGEATFHTCLEAKARGVALILVGHYASERFAVESLAEKLGQAFSDCEVWASQKESDPLLWT